MEPGQTLGHEFMGIVEEAGSEVNEVKVGDKVVIPIIVYHNLTYSMQDYINNPSTITVPYQ
jgi:threonine dehydrogenase-like Zn-dependent dehydrogenase